MPIYEFVCQKCKNEFEKVVSFSETKWPACPACTSDEVERQLGIPAIHFKGSGWYINDSKETKGKDSDKESATKGDQGEKASADKSGDNKSASSDSKSDSSKAESSSGSTESSTSSKEETAKSATAKSAA